MGAAHKKTADAALPAEELRVARFRISRPGEKKRLIDVAFRTKHLENMILLLRQSCLDRGLEDVAKLLLNPGVVRALAAGSPGGKSADLVTKTRTALAGHQLFDDFLAVAGELKEKNVHALVKKIKAAFASYYTKRKNGDMEARPPRPKKLVKVAQFSFAVDQCAYSLKRKNCVRLNLGSKMESFHLAHDKIVAACGSLEALQAIEVVMAHGEAYLHISYNKPIAPIAQKTSKFAGIDLGLKNIAALFVGDRETPSLVVEGANLRQYNARFNREVSKLKSQRDLARQALDKMASDGKEDQYSSLLSALSQGIRRRYRERAAFFADHFHKCATRLLEYCQHAQVSDLYLSRNLGFLKQQKGLSREHNQRFCEIPMVKLVDHLKDKAADYGVKVHDTVDEAYSSKVSCISGNVVAVQQEGERIRALKDQQEAKKQRSQLSNAFGGRRDRRDRYVDFGSGKKFLADLNGAVNHIKIAVSSDFSWLASDIWKLANPIVLKCDSMFLDLRFAKVQDKEERPESRQKSWLYATWSPCQSSS